MPASTSNAKVFGAVTLAWMIGASIASAQDTPAAREAAAPDKCGELKYTPSTRLKIQYLQGNPYRTGPYKIRVTIPPKSREGPRSHSDTRQILVISGAWYVGQGNKFDPASATKMTAGTSFEIPANAVHYDFTTSESAVIQISGTGISRITYPR